MSSNGTATPFVTCAFCTENNTHNCIKCQKPYCMNHCSKISPQLCQDCFLAVSVIIDDYLKEDKEEVYDEATDTVTTEVHRRKCKRVRLDGPDYVWYNVFIQKATDAELAPMIEFHKFMVSRMENEKATRIIRTNQASTNGKATKNILSVQTQTTVNKKKTIKQQKDPRSVLLASGIKEDNPLFAVLLAQMEKK